MNLHGKKFLLVEDDHHIYLLIKAMLKPYDIELKLAKDGELGLQEALSGDYNLILLDIMLPKKDGLLLCKELKEAKIETPLIMLTAKVEESDKILGLELGADDYVTKPFSPKELMARIKAVLRRFEKVKKLMKKKGQTLNFTNIDLKIDLRSYEVYVRSKRVNIAPKELELLAFLAKNPNQAFSREELLDNLWQTGSQHTRTIDEHVKRIRRKLKDAEIKLMPIKTVWGVGYKFKVEENRDV
ncbi:response regulator transcription factor [Orenia marismortui]|uniref:response regulator transcription factor n=1 Tax=Orenia marismortui TaxID=46469 RepID=UPI0003637B40|nr:response regulator transcription factor [Orenia marismortui]